MNESLKSGKEKTVLVVIIGLILESLNGKFFYVLDFVDGGAILEISILKTPQLCLL